MTSSPHSPLSIGPLISAALARVWHFKLELGVMWLGYLLTIFVFLPYLPDIQRLRLAVEQSPNDPRALIDSGVAFQIIVLSLLVIVFQMVLWVLWIRVLRLGTAEAFSGGVRMLAMRTMGLLVRSVALTIVLIGLLAILGIAIQSILSIFFSQGTTLSLPVSGVRLILILVGILLAALTIRISFVLISPIFDVRTPIERAWNLVNGNTWRILGAIIVVCFPIVFAASLLDSAILRMGPDPAEAGASPQLGTGILLALQISGSTASCLQMAAALAILVEAFERLGAWGRGRIVSEIV